MPVVKDRVTGNVVANLPYDNKGEAQAEQMVKDNPGYVIVNAPDMRERMYAGGGKVGYKKIGYKKGGKV